MPSSDERRKGLRACLPAEFYFNILESAEDFTRGQASVIRRLGAIDALKVPAPKTESQILLTRIDQKLSLLVGILAEGSSRKSYINHGVVLDISEFGLSFGHALDIPANTVLEIGLKLPHTESRIMDISGRVIHVNSPAEKSSNFTNIYGVEFIDIQIKDQNEIVQWIFSHQRELIRRRRELTA